MGCGSSRTSHVIELDPSKPPPEPKARASSAKSLISKPKSAQSSSSLRFFSGRKKRTSTDPSPSGSRPGSGQTLATISAVNIRTQSATSAHSNDSGIGTDVRCSPVKPDAADSLKKTPPLLPIIDNLPPRERVDERKILESLRGEGLLNNEATETTKGGVKFELDLGDLQPPKRRPPPRLARLERTQQLQITKQKIKEKLDTAEKRRKKLLKLREQEKVEKSRDRDAKNLEVKFALLEIDKTLEQEKKQALDNKIKEHVERRQSNIQQVVDKQLERDQRVLQASMRKASGSALQDPIMQTPPNNQQAISFA